MKHFLWFLMFMTGCALAAPVKDLTFEEFDSQFRCPETYLNDSDRKRGIEESLVWFAAHTPNATVEDLAQFRMSLLVNHKCEVTLGNIQRSNEHAVFDLHSCDIAIHDFLLISNAVSEFGCKPNLLTKSTRTYLDLIGRFSSQKCGLASLPDVGARIESARQENERQYVLTKQFQPQERVKSVFCHGFDTFTMRADLFKDLMSSSPQSRKTKPPSR